MYLADEQVLQALEDLRVSVRRIETTQSDIMEALRRIEMTQRFLYCPLPPPPTAPPTSASVIPSNTVPVAPTTPQSFTPVHPRPSLSVTESTPETMLHQEATPTPTSYPEPLGLNHMYVNLPLASEEIPKHTLMTIEDSLKGCKDLKCVEKASTLTQKLAKEAIFGVEVMKRCTPGGTKELPALPKEEMLALKKAVYKELPQFWQSPFDFEKLWKRKCWPAVEQACRRLRRRLQQ